MLKMILCNLYKAIFQSLQPLQEDSIENLPRNVVEVEFSKFLILVVSFLTMGPVSLS